MDNKGKGKEKTSWWKKSVKFDENLEKEENKVRAAMNYRAPASELDSPMGGMDDQSGGVMSGNGNEGGGMSGTGNGGGVVLKGLGGPDYKHSGVKKVVGKDRKHSGMGGMDPREYKAAYLRGISGTNKPQATPPATKHSRDTVEHRYQKALAKDPSSYSLSATSVHQQAAQESNFIGSAYFYYADNFHVQGRLAGDYVVVYARPKYSKIYPRGSAVSTFEPDFNNRITIYTEVPREGGGVISDSRIKEQLPKGSWGVGALQFNGAKIALYFDYSDARSKSMAEVRTETFPDEPRGTGLLDQVLFMGAIELGSKARFGIKEMVFENNIPYGFEFIDLSLSVWNQISGEKDSFMIVAVKMPKKGNVASAFILKQPINMPHPSWYKWQRHLTRDQNKARALVQNISKEVSDWYDSGNDVMDFAEEDREKLWTDLWGEKPAK